MHVDGFRLAHRHTKYKSCSKNSITISEPSVSYFIAEQGKRKRQSVGQNPRNVISKGKKKFIFPTDMDISDDEH